MVYMKHLRRVLANKKIDLLNKCICIINIAFCCLLLGCAEEHYECKVLKNEEIAEGKFDLTEMYDLIVTEYSVYVGQHRLVQIKGTVSIDGIDSCSYDSVEFAFWEFLDESGESGRVDIRFFDITFSERNEIQIQEYKGTSKASNTPGERLINDVSGMDEITRCFYDYCRDNSLTGKQNFKIWRTVNISESNELGDIAIKMVPRGDESVD